MALRAVFLLVLGLVAMDRTMAPGPAVAADLAATVLRLDGSASARTAGGDVRPLEEGSDLHVGDQVLTADDTRLRMRLIDGAVVTLGDNSTFTLVGYEPSSQGMVLDLVRGVFLAVSGAVSEQRAKPVTVRTPLGSMGVRGTTFWGRQNADHLEVLLLDGGPVWVESEGLRVLLIRPQAGADVDPGRAPTAPKPWGPQRIAAAIATVTFD